MCSQVCLIINYSFFSFLWVLCCRLLIIWLCTCIANGQVVIKTIRNVEVRCFPVIHKIMMLFTMIFVDVFVAHSFIFFNYLFWF